MRNKFFALLLILLSTPVVAEQLSSLSLLEAFVIDSRIEPLLQLTKNEPEKVKVQLATLTQLEQDLDIFNAAERHLILQISANMALNANKLAEVVNLMESADRKSVV